MRPAVLGFAVLAGIVFSGCGGGDGSSLVLFGASSLEEPVSEYAEAFPDADVRASFAGSGQLAAQIRQGATPDVFASADTEYPAQLHREGLVERPRIFAANRLVIGVPTDSGVSTLSDLARPNLKIVIGGPSVPVGAYTRTVLARLPGSTRRAILDNVRSEEPEVSSVVAKLEQRAADAGFIYVTDARSAGSSVRTIAIPSRLQPDVAYAAAVVREGGDRTLARAFLDGLVQGGAAAHLRRAGFLPPP